MGAWLLILFAHVGMMGDGNSNSLTTAYAATQGYCEAAGQAAVTMAKGTTKQVSYRCVKVQ